MRRFMVFLLSLSLLVSCAKITALEGGDKDTLPPTVDTLHSTPMLQTNFRPKSIQLTFDEWITLKDVFKNVLVSPPLKKRPKITLKKKTVLFEFNEEEVLRDSTTYTINFGSAISDITENNSATGLTYVFSTGPEIDSLSIGGKVMDAFTKAPVENVNVMLYDVLEDSIVYQEKPYYLAITNKNGTFKINNIRPGIYKAFALKDGDSDFKFSQFDEPMGFLADPVIVNDSTPKLTFLLSSEIAPIKLKGKTFQANGIRSLEFNETPQNPSFKPLNIDEFRFLPQGDSIKIWYTGVDSSSQLVILVDNEILDTISLRPKSKLKNISAIELKIVTNIAGSVHPKKSIELKMNLPIEDWKDSLIILSKDSTHTALPMKINIKKDDPTVLILNHPWQESVSYDLTLFPKGIKGINGQEFKDTLSQKLSIIPIGKLGNILLDIVPPDSTQQYVIKLMQKKKAISKKILLPNEREITWSLMPPGEYSVELIEDKNKNGIWDGGNYLQRQQPERVFVKSLDKLRANWDLDIKWTPNSTVAPKKTTDK